MCTVDFSTSNCKLSWFFLYVNSFFGKERPLLSDVMSRPLGLTASMAMYHSNIGVQPRGLFSWRKDCLIELASANHMDLHFQVSGMDERCKVIVGQIEDCFHVKNPCVSS